MGRIILYRLLYLSGPVLAFALLLSQRQLGIGFYFKAETLLAFVDDAAVERPGLLPELGKAFYVGRPADDEEFAARLAVYASLKSDAARSAALRHFLSLPEQATDDQRDHLLALALPIWDGATAGPLQAAAAGLLYAVVDHGRPTPEAVHRLVAARGRTLPTEVQRRYLSAHPDTPHLSHENLPYFAPPKEPELTPDLRRARDEWKAGVGRAVAADHAARDEVSARLNHVRERSVEIYDGTPDGDPRPSTIPTNLHL